MPVAEAHLTFESVVNGGAFLVWSNVLGINRYHLRLDEDQSKGPPLLDKDIGDASQARVPQLKPGRYVWTVTSIDSEGKISDGGEKRTFTVEDVPHLSWGDEKDKDTYLYATAKPSLRASWKPLSRMPSMKTIKYKVTLKSDGPDQAFSTFGYDQMVSVPADGVYHLQVEATDEKSNVIARSSMREVTVKVRPLLPPPSFGDRAPATVLAQRNGSAPISWNPVNGAKSYWVQIKDGDGKIIKKEKANGPSLVVKGLLPGQYEISLASIDDYGRVGEWGADHPLSVPDLSDMRAPQFKKFQVQ